VAEPAVASRPAVSRNRCLAIGVSSVRVRAYAPLLF
jgi:hypothetical protein